MKFILKIFDENGEEISKRNVPVRPDDLLAASYYARMMVEELYRDALYRIGRLDQYRAECTERWRQIKASSQ